VVAVVEQAQLELMAVLAVREQQTQLVVLQ
jgi:hypothetical protein